MRTTANQRTDRSRSLSDSGRTADVRGRAVTGARRATRSTARRTANRMPDAGRGVIGSVWLCNMEGGYGGGVSL